MNNPQKRAVIYTRVSSERQVENMSLPEQLKSCEMYCMSNDLVVDSIFTDEGASAKTTARPKFQEMLEYCRKNKHDIDVVVVYKLDRFARKVEDHAAVTAILKKMDILLLSATEMISETTTGKLMEHMLSSFAEFDNSVRSERCSKGMKARAMSGAWVASPPIGYAIARDAYNSPTLKLSDDGNAKRIALFFETFAKGNHRQSDAIQLADKLGIRTSKGNPLCKNGVIGMLHNIAYTGYIKSELTDNKRIKALHPQIISYDLFLAVQAVLNGRTRKNTPEKRLNSDFPMRRYLKCGLCGHPMTASRNRGRKGIYYPAYSCSRCKKKDIGKTVRIPIEQAHEAFEKLLTLLQPAPWICDAFKEIVIRRWNYEFREVQTQRRRIDNEIAILENRKNTLVDKLLDGHIIDTVYEVQEQRIFSQRLDLDREREELKSTEQNKESIVDEAIRFISNANALWVNSPLEDKQRFQNLVFQQGIFINADRSFGTTKLSPVFEAITDIENFFIENKITEKSKKSIWYTRQDLNLRPLGSKPSTLSTELRVHNRGNYTICVSLKL